MCMITLYDLHSGLIDCVLYFISATGQPQLNTYDTSLCDGTPKTVTTLTSQCMPVDDLYDFADAPPRADHAQDATFVGDWAKSVSVRCTGKK